MPEGWKSAIITMNSFGKMVESVRFLSPDGRFCTSRVEAIKYLLKDGGANHDDLMRMQVEKLQLSSSFTLLFKMGLLQDGWETDENLPLGWFMKPDRCRGKRKEVGHLEISENTFSDPCVPRRTTTTYPPTSSTTAPPRRPSPT